MPRPIDPVTLRHFVAVCEEGSIAKAAAREALVPSALSKRIAALEADMGVALLVRRRRGVEPTPAGQALLSGARELLSGLQRVRAEVSSFAAGVQGTVRVLASPSVLAEHLPDDLALFLASHPGLRVSLDERTSPEIVRCLRERSTDLGVLWDQAELAGLDLVPYRTDQLCVAMPPSHPWARRNALHFVDTVDQETVGVSTTGLLDQLLHRQAALAGRTLAHRLQVSSLDAACRLVAAGLGIAVLPREAAAPHAGAGRLALVPLADPWARRRFVVASGPAKKLSDSARLLREHLGQRG
jgi:DNA-binding transcriptional LysR family regulator